MSISPFEVPTTTTTQLYEAPTTTTTQLYEAPTTTTTQLYEAPTTTTTQSFETEQNRGKPIHIFIKLENTNYSHTFYQDNFMYEIYGICEAKCKYVIRKNHNITYKGKPIRDELTFGDYNIKDNDTICVVFSVGKDNIAKPQDIEGLKEYQQLVDSLLKERTDDVWHIFSKMSYNVCNDCSKKELIQQLQPETIKHIIISKFSFEHLEINIILSDNEFIDYNKRIFNLFSIFSGPRQINEMLYLSSPEKISNRIIKFSTNVQSNDKLKSYLADEQGITNQGINKKYLENSNIKINFYFVGVSLNLNCKESDITVNNCYGIDFSRLRNYYVNMWTGVPLIRG
jgi:hypothetical protein